MRLTRARILVAAGVVAAAATVAGSVLAAAPASAGPTVSQTVLVNQCTGGGQVRPGTIALPACMPANELIGHAKWTSWGLSAAFGSADLEVNNCTPSASCGVNQFTKYPILIVTWRAEPWRGAKGEDYYSRMTWIFTGKRPKGIPVTQTITWLPDAQ
jgi:hypothetical protein